MTEKKQAVVVIHGMGEQRPMDTLRSLVTALWEKHAGLTSDISNRWWIKPDERAGLKELRRITTGGIERTGLPEGEEGKRTDFYEFYWADLMQGTTLQHLQSWVRGLLLRNPAVVPWDVMFIWIAMVLSAAAGLYVGLKELFVRLAGDDTATACRVVIGDIDIGTLACDFLRSVDGWLGEALGRASGAMEYWPWILAGIALFFLIVGLISLREGQPYSTRPAFGVSEEERNTDIGRLAATVVYGLASIAIIALFLVILAASGVWAALVAAAAGWMVHSFAVPYFGDVARYVRADPANVSRRKAIRDRGLALLHALHESDEYDRIIIVSHSLGTIVAYDLINLLWTQLGPSHRNSSIEIARQPFEEMDAYLQKVAMDDLPERERTESAVRNRITEFRQLQRAISARLSRVPLRRDEDGRIVHSPWLISDLITVGSPLSHAEFLLSRDEAGLRKLVDERVLPVCPPTLEWREDRECAGRTGCGSMMYNIEKGDKSFPHHATCFAAVRWTNIYDQAQFAFPLVGDLVSGPVWQNFGSSVRTTDVPGDRAGSGDGLWPAEVSFNGIDEYRVRIRRGVLGLPHLFTHTKYWAWPKDNSASAKSGRASVPEHIAILRDAVDLAEVDPLEGDESIDALVAALYPAKVPTDEQAAEKKAAPKKKSAKKRTDKTKPDATK